MSDRGPRPRTEREWGCPATSGIGRCESLLLSALLSATRSVRDERRVSREDGQTGLGERMIASERPDPRRPDAEPEGELPGGGGGVHPPVGQRLPVLGHVGRDLVLRREGRIG